MPTGSCWTDSEAAAAFSCHTNTVVSIRKRFVEEGLEAALTRKKRANPPRKQESDGESEAKIIALRCSQPPEGHSRWTLRLLADKIVELDIVSDISHETVYWF